MNPQSITIEVGSKRETKPEEYNCTNKLTWVNKFETLAPNQLRDRNFVSQCMPRILECSLLGC